MKKYLRAIFVVVLTVFVFIFSFLTYITWPAMLHILTPSAFKPPVPEYHVPEIVLKKGAYPDTAQAVLEEYLRLDAAGGYLSDEGERYLVKLSPINFGKKTVLLNVMVIKDYKIKYQKITPDEVVAEVEYDLLGELEHLAWFLPAKFSLEREKRSYGLTLARKDGQWTLNTELWSSYISVPTSLAYIKMAGTIAATDKTAPRFIAKGASNLIEEIKRAAKK